MKTSFEKLKLDSSQIFTDNLLERKNYDKSIYFYKKFLILFLIFCISSYTNSYNNNIHLTTLSGISSLSSMYFFIRWFSLYLNNPNIYLILFLNSFGIKITQ